MLAYILLQLKLHEQTRLLFIMHLFPLSQSSLGGDDAAIRLFSIETGCFRLFGLKFLVIQFHSFFPICTGSLEHTLKGHAAGSHTFAIVVASPHLSLSILQP